MRTKPNTSRWFRPRTPGGHSRARKGSQWRIYTCEIVSFAGKDCKAHKVAAWFSIMIGEIRQHLKASPFDAFTIVTSSGRRYPVPSADHAGLNPQGSRVVVWFDDDASVTIAGLHIVAVEKGIPSVSPNGGQDAPSSPE